MAVVMRILGWKAQGLRCPDHEISCADSNGSPYPVSLIQMPNGTGKTTTLALLRAALSGSANDPGWSRHAIFELRKRSSDQPEGFFEVRLLLNDRRATIVMVFDFQNGRVSYKTTHGPGQREGFRPPSVFRRFMNENFVNFYVFDGELAQHLLDREHTDAQVVVESLFQMNAFDLMARKVGEYWDSKTQSASATEERGLSRRRNRLIVLRMRLAKLKRKQRELQEERVEISGQLRRREDAYNEEIKREDARYQSLNEAETKVDHLKGRVREEALDVLERMRDPHALSSCFAESLLALKDGLDKVRLPESAAREFFEDLALEAECVCGRAIDGEIAEAIRARAAQYLGTEEVSLLNSMKTAIKDFVGDTPDEGEKDLNRRIAILSSAVTEERDACNDLDAATRSATSPSPSSTSTRPWMRFPKARSSSSTSSA